MVAILNFMYKGEVNVNQEDLQMFLAAAEELRIKGLSQVVSSILIISGSGRIEAFFIGSGQKQTDQDPDSDLKSL